MTWAASWRISSSARRLAGDDLDLASDDGIGKVAHGAVDRDGDGLLGKRLGNGFGDIPAGCASGVAAHGTIGKCQGNNIQT
jgi:hypothetical protein